MLCGTKFLALQRFFRMYIISQLHLFNYQIFRNIGFMIFMINSNMNTKHKWKKLTALSLKDYQLCQTIKRWGFFFLRLMINCIQKYDLSYGLSPLRFLQLKTELHCSTLLRKWQNIWCSRAYWQALLFRKC